jgi:hypothetical protein
MRHRASVLLAGLALLSSRAAAAQGVALLRELPTLGVHVVGVTAEATALGIDGTDLQRRAEAKLRAAGFEVPAPAELAIHPETPRLVVNIGVFTTRDSNAVYRVGLELLEEVQLMRNGLATHAVGWSEQILGLTPAIRSGDAARQAVDRLIGVFVAESRQAMLGLR